MSDRRLLLAALSWAVQSCAAGYHWYRTPGPDAASVPGDWRVSTVLVEAADARRLGTIAVHLLRERHGVVDARFDGRPSDAALTLSFAKGPRRSSVALLIPSFITFSVLPGYGEEEEDVTLTATAPDGTRTSASRKLRSVMLWWLPFAFAAPNFIGSIGATTDDVQRLRTEAEEWIVEDLLEEIAPFVAAHAGTGPRP